MATYKSRIEKLESINQTVKRKFGNTIYMYENPDGTTTIDGKPMTMLQAKNKYPGDVLIIHCHYEEGTPGRSITVFEN